MPGVQVNSLNNRATVRFLSVHKSIGFGLSHRGEGVVAASRLR
jgi:hypothetical protein